MKHVHVHVHHHNNDDEIKKLLETVSIINLKLDKIMDFQEQLNQLFGELNATTNGIAGDVTKVVNSNNNIAADLQRLKDQIANGLTKAQAEAAVTTLTGAVSALKTGAEGLAAAATALEATAAVVPEAEEENPNP